MTLSEKLREHALGWFGGGPSYTIRDDVAFAEVMMARNPGESFDNLTRDERRMFVLFVAESVEGI